MLSQYEQKAMRTRRVFGVILGSLIALIGTMAKARRSFALSCLGLKTGNPLLGLLTVLSGHRFQFGFLRGSAGTSVSRSS